MMSIKQKLLLGVSAAFVCFICPIIANDEDFQYRFINVGVVVRADRIPVKNITNAERGLKEIIANIINNNNTNLLFNTGNFTSNYTKVSNVTIVPLDTNDDVSAFKDIHVILSMIDCQETHYLNNRVTLAYGPFNHIALTETGCPRLDSAAAITIPITWYTVNADLLQLFIDIRKDNTLPKWDKAVVIYDVQAGQSILDTFVQGFVPRSDFTDISVSLFTVDSMSMWKSYHNQIEEILQKYQGSAPANFVIVTSVKNVNAVLEVAKRLRLLAYNKQWLFVSNDANAENFEWNYVVKRVLNDGVNVAFISNSSFVPMDPLPDPLSCHLEGLLSLFMETLESLAESEFNSFVQVSDEEWDIIKPTVLDRVSSLIHNITDRLEETVLNMCDKNSSTWRLEAGENGKFGKRVFEVGFWNPVTGLRMKDDLFPHVTGGFRGRRVNVASIHFPPWHMIYKNPENESEVTYSGLMFEVLGHMAHNLNFTYQVLEPRAGESWGVLQSDGQWNGMMKMIIDKKVVIAAAAFTVTPERSQVVNFTEVMERESYVFMVNRPSELSRVLLFAEPFSSEVWGCIFVTVFVVSPCLYVVHRYSSFYKFYGKTNDMGLFQLRNCFWYVYGALLQQGGTHLPEAISGRMLIGFWWLFVLVVVTTYSGNLVAFLTFPKVENAVNTIDDLLHYRGVNSWGFISTDILGTLLQRSKNPKFKELYEKSLMHAAFNGTVIDLVRDRGHAYFDWKIVLLTSMSEELKRTGLCEFALGSEEIFEQKIALVVPNDSPYLPLFNKEITEMLQSGLIKKWKNTYWPQKDRCSSRFLASVSRTVGIGDMQGSFYLLLMGVFVASTVLLFEYLYTRHRKKKMINTIKIIVTNNKDQQFWQQKKYPFLQ